MGTHFELFAARAAVASLTLAAVLPLVPIGAWVVRLFDFPRLQLAIVAFLVLLVLAIRVIRLTNPIESSILIAMTAVVAVWQSSRVVAYTPLWPKEVRTATATQPGRFTIGVANVKFNNEQRGEAVEQLLERDDDLVLLVEVDEHWHEALRPLRERYPHSTGVVLPEGLGIWLYSRLEVESSEVRYLVSEDRPSIVAVLRDEAGQRIDFVGLHPTPPGLYDKTEGNRYDSRIRDAELLLVANEIEQRPDANWLVAGDFNDVAWSHTTRLFKRVSGLRDPRVGRGLYNTYHAAYWVLRFPIDHVFVSSSAEVARLTRYRPTGSDHFAIVTDLQFSAVPEPKPTPKDGDKADMNEIIEEGFDEASERGEAADQARATREAKSSRTTLRGIVGSYR